MLGCLNWSDVQFVEESLMDNPSRHGNSGSITLNVMSANTADQSLTLTRAQDRLLRYPRREAKLRARTNGLSTSGLTQELL